MDMIKSRKRVKELGEVFTPQNIVLEMITLIPDEEWRNVSSTTLEPTCGNGNFLVEVVKKKMECGLTPTQALNTTFGTDICPENIKEARHRLLKLVINKYPKAEVRYKRIWVCVIHHNVFEVNDFLKAVSDIKNKPYFMRSSGLKIKRLQEGKKDKDHFLDNKKREEIENRVKGMKVDVDFDFEEILGDNRMNITLKNIPKKPKLKKAKNVKGYLDGYNLTACFPKEQK